MSADRPVLANITKINFNRSDRSQDLPICQLSLESEHEKPVFTPAFRVGVARIFQNAKRLDFAVWLRGPKIPEPCSWSMLCLWPTDLFSIFLNNPLSKSYQNPRPKHCRQAALLIAKTRSSNRPALAAEQLLSRKPRWHAVFWWVIQWIKIACPWKSRLKTPLPSSAGFLLNSVTHDDLRRLRLSCSTFSRDYNGLPQSTRNQKLGTCGRWPAWIGTPKRDHFGTRKTCPPVVHDATSSKPAQLGCMDAGPGLEKAAWAINQSKAEFLRPVSG